MYIYKNNNPDGRHVGDCVVRALSEVLGVPWEAAYWKICVQGGTVHDMPSGDNVWGSVLRKYGFKREIIPDTCPDCYTVKDFTYDHPHGRYILATGTHVIAVVNGNYIDTWDSGNEIPIYYWRESK